MPAVGACLIFRCALITVNYNLNYSDSHINYTVYENISFTVHFCAPAFHYFMQ